MSSKKSITDFISLIAQRFAEKDDTRLSDRWISRAIDNTRAELIVEKYRLTETVDFAWLNVPFYVDFYKITVADDPNMSFCNCDMMKAEIPPVISLTNYNANNQDVGVYSLFSACGKYAYYPRPLQMLQNIPKENTLSKFKYYARYNTTVYATVYATGTSTKLRLSPILLYPEDGFIINSAPVLSGSIVSGTVYIVKFGSIFYNSVTYYANDTFTGTSATTFTGTGKVYLQNQVAVFEDTTDYPVGGDMERQIVLEILTKEFGIEESMISELKNDNIDDQKTQKKPLQKQGAL
jgi:hypothetical protein